MKFRKRPVVIEAIRADFGYNNLDEIVKFVGDSLCPIERRPDYKLKIKTLEGDMICNPGDWIIKEPYDMERKFYPCKSDIFEKTYEEIK